VRSAPFFAIIALSVVAVAKEPLLKPLPSERKLLDRLENPEEKEFDLKQMTPFGRSKSEFTAKPAHTTSFYVQQKFQSKGYDSKEFRTKSAWDGDFKFSTKEARTKTYDTKKAPYDKTAAVKDARDAGKSASTREFYQANRTSPFKGRSQALFDKEGPAAQAKIGPSWSGNLKELTVDDVKEILNKNK